MKALNILVAEDNDDHAELITDSLKNFNNNNVITRVENGEELIKLLKSSTQISRPGAALPDLILVDIKMPRMDGLSALEIIKQDPTFKKIPLMMVSTSNNINEIKQSYDLGANSFITKPLDHSDFTKKIRKLNAYWADISEIPTNENTSN